MSRLTVELLVSTVRGKVPLLFNEPANLAGASIVVVNQMDGEGQKLEGIIASPSCVERLRVTDVFDHGLARSRNQALGLCEGDIGLFCDDDTILLPGSIDAVRAAFSRHPSAAAVSFRIRTPNGEPYKRYRGAPFRHGRISLLRVSEIELAVRAGCMREEGVWFDERFGLGAEFPSGEGAVFLGDALAAGLELRYEPTEIVLHAHESSGKRLGDRHLLRAKGAVMRRIYGPVAGAAVACAFALVKRRHYDDAFSLVGALRQIFDGYRSLGSQGR